MRTVYVSTETRQKQQERRQRQLLCASRAFVCLCLRMLHYTFVTRSGETSGNDFCEIRVRTSACKEKLNYNTASRDFGVGRRMFVDARYRTPKAGVTPQPTTTAAAAAAAARYTWNGLVERNGDDYDAPTSDSSAS